MLVGSSVTLHNITYAILFFVPQTTIGPGVCQLTEADLFGGNNSSFSFLFYRHEEDVPMRQAKSLDPILELLPRSGVFPGWNY